MKTEIIKPKKEEKEDNNNIITPIVYLLIGVLLAFMSNQVQHLLFYIIGIFVIVYGVKLMVFGYRNKEVEKIRNMHFSVAIVSIIIGLMLILLSEVLEVSIRYVVGFFLIYMGVSRLLTQIYLQKLLSWSNLSNIILIISGLFSIIYSNIILVVIGWILIINSFILFFDYIKK